MAYLHKMMPEEHQSRDRASIHATRCLRVASWVVNMSLYNVTAHIYVTPRQPRS